MNILIVHNFYQQPGGEDHVFAGESALLEAHGHRVTRFTVHNDAIDTMSKPLVALNTLWNARAADTLAKEVRDRRIELVHFHNTFPLLSPSVYRAARRAGAAVVQTLHNFRLMCAPGTFFRDGKVCEDCLGRLPVPAVARRCYRDSLAGSATAAAMITLHRGLRTYQRHVDRFIALAEFSRQKFIHAGLPADRISIKPNFLSPDLGPGTGAGGYALFVGRLSAEKGINLLLDAAPLITPHMPLWIVGAGPLAPDVRALAMRQPKVRYLGQQPHAHVQQLMREARVLVSASIWFEAGVPRTIIEAFASGTPVAAFDIGGSATLRGEDTGALIAPLGDAPALAKATIEAGTRPDMRDAARRQFLRHYTPQANYHALMEIYTQALRSRGNAPQPSCSPGGMSGSSGSTRSWASLPRKNVNSCAATVSGSGSRRS